MSKSYAVSEALKATLQAVCTDGGKTPWRFPSKEGAEKFLSDLTEVVAGGAFEGNVVYANFDCPSWLSQVIGSPIDAAERMTQRTFVSRVIEVFEQRHLDWELLVRSGDHFSGIPGFKSDSSQLPDFAPAGWRDAHVRLHAAWVAKAFTPPAGPKPPKQQSDKGFSPEDRAAMVERVAAGEPIEAVAAAFNTTPHKVKSVVDHV